ncbi:hypothetical protein H4R19_000093 [Coemansia spiralis]|nr:hypothetical protein H4R19_000093 [Coemansia spiralis]
MLSVFGGGKVEVSQDLTIFVKSESDVDNRRIVIANSMLEAADSCLSRKLVIGGMNAISSELITYTGLTHLYFNGPMNADDVMQLICRQRHLVSLCVSFLNMAEAQTDFSIPECAENEPVAPLDTQLRELIIKNVYEPMTIALAFSMLKYLLLRLPTLKSVTAQFVPVEQIQAFIDQHVQWYPHLANVKLME